MEPVVITGTKVVCGVGTWLRKREQVALWSRYLAEEEGTSGSVVKVPV